MKIPIILHQSKIEMSDYWKRTVHDKLIDIKKTRAYIHTTQPESRKQRGFCMASLIPLLVYLDGNDHKDGQITDWYFEFYKKELTPATLNIKGKIQTVGQSTKGSENLNNFIDKLQDYLDEQYGIKRDSKIVSPDEYKKFKDTIYPFSNEYDDFIDYAVKMKWL
jgi:hypothetical protein